MDQQRLAALLKETQTPDTQRLRAVTSELKKDFYSHPASLLALIEIIATYDDHIVRQQAAIQAASLVPKYWGKTPKEQKPAVRQHLVQATMREPNPKSRHAESRVIAAVATLDFDDGEWQDLVPALFGLASNSDVAQREVGSYILFSLLEANPTHFTARLRELLELFSHSLNDAQSADVRINSMMSIGALLLLFEPDEDEEAVSALQTLIPAMVNVLKGAVEANDEEKANQAFEVFQQFLAYESALLGGYLKDLVQFMIDLAANRDVDDEIRSQALAFLAQTVRYRRMKIQGMPDMGNQLTLKSLVILTEFDDEEDEDEINPARAALALLDQLSSDLPPRQVVVPLLDALPKFSTSEDPGYRKAGILALGTIVEGAPDFVASQLKSIMPHLISLLNDSDVGVRHTALVGLARLADDVAEALAPDHEALMAAVVKNLQAAVAPASDPAVAKKNVGVIRSVCGALDSMAEGLDAELMKQYAPDLVGNIGLLMGHDDYKVRIGAAGALGAIAESLDKEFAPYFEKVIEALAGYLTIKETEEDLALRGGVSDALGRIASAVGREAFQPYVVDLMRSSEEALHLEDSRLKESSFILWSSLAKVYEKDFAHFLPGVMKGLFRSLELEEDEITLQLTEQEQNIIGTSESVITAGKKVKIKQADENEPQTMDQDDEDDEDLWDDIGVSAEALEKEVAIEVLGDIISHACGPSEIQEYLEKAIEMISPLAEHTYEGCRKAAIGTLWRAYARVWQLMEEETKTNWEPGFPPKQTPTTTVVKLGEIVVNATLQSWAEESDRSVVTDINRNVAATLRACGPTILAQSDLLQQVVTVLGTLLTRSHPCQLDLGDEDDDDQEVEGSSEYDWLVIDTALDVVVGLAVALGPSFAELWKVFERPIMKFGSSTETNERSVGVGVIGECAANMKEAITPYTSKLLVLLMKRLSDTDPETRSNGIYAVGQLIYNSGDVATYLPYYEQILSKLESLLSVTEARTRDNAAGCLCRLISAHPDKVPLAQVLPALVELLPLTEDYEENEPVYSTLLNLHAQKEPTVVQLMPKLMPILQKVLEPPTEQLDDETRELIQRTLSSL